MNADEARARELYAEISTAIPQFEGFMRELYAVGRISPDFVGPIHPKMIDPPMIAGLRNIKGLEYL